MPPFLAEATKEDPIGFNCEKQILNITEVSFVEQVRCYNTTEQVCSMVNMGPFISFCSVFLQF